MKVVVTGATGSIGGGVLALCLRHPGITSVVALSRKPLAEHPKLTTLIVEDFTQYPEEALDADCCLWALGNFKNLSDDKQYKKTVMRDYPTAFLHQVSQYRSGKGAKGPFRFVMIGGGLAEHDQSANLWVMGGARKMMGQALNSVLDLAHGDPGLDVYVFNCGYVIDDDSYIAYMPLQTVKKSTIGAAMADVAMKGDERKIWWNSEIVERGRAVQQCEGL